MPIPANGHYGRVFADLAGPELNASERELLAHPALAGIILFSRNTLSADQTAELCRAIKGERSDLIIAIDQEGGRVQRLRKGVTAIPPMALFDALYQRDPHTAVHMARETGWLLATELKQCGIDLTFAPVLDLDANACPAIGDRAFSTDPDRVIALAGAFIEGLADAGLASVGKHFPGHGGVSVDSHLDLPVDDRSLADIRQLDLKPFSVLAGGALTGVMPAHILFPEVDASPVGFSSVWLQSVLRQELGFKGLIFSDDLSMNGAAWAGTAADRAQTAAHAGCDFLLVCNDRSAAQEVLDVMRDQPLSSEARPMLTRLYARHTGELDHERVAKVRQDIISLLS